MKPRYDVAVDAACRARSKSFDIRDCFGERGTWLSYLLMDANRHGCGIGGDAFRHWVAGVCGGGVYVFADNYRIGVAIMTDPMAKVTPGCQESCANADPWPRLSVGRWLRGGHIPEELKEHALDAANKLVRKAANAVLRAAWKEKARMEAKAAERTRDYGLILNAWSGQEIVEGLQ